MENVCPAECDRASEISFCLEDEAPPETVLNAEETEELTQSLKESVDTENVKPKLQCLMSNPCFSMVTVQCEDSGIHWETSSSRCSTPWASEASTTSDVYSMDSSSVGTPGKVIFIMDEGKLRRKRVRAPSKFSRPSSHQKKSLSRPKQESSEKVSETVNGGLEKSVDSKVDMLNTVLEQVVETKEKEVQEPLEQLPVESSINNVKSTTDDIKRTQFSSKVQPNLLSKIDVEKEVYLVDTVSGLLKQSESISSTPLNHTEHQVLQAQQEMFVPVEENFNLSYLLDEDDSQSNKPQTLPELVEILLKEGQEERRKKMSMSSPDGTLPNNIPHNSSFEANTDNVKAEQTPGDLVRTTNFVSDNTTNLHHPEEHQLTRCESGPDMKEPPDIQSDVFSIVSDGSEILNILAPPLISSVDQEASNEMQDKLEYLKENPILTSKPHVQSENSSSKPNVVVDTPLRESHERTGQSKEDEKNPKHIKRTASENMKEALPDKNTNEINYFEKFTLIDDKIPIELETGRPTTQVKKANTNTELCFKDSEKAAEDDYYLLENLDESFYGVMRGEDDLVTTNDKSFQSGNNRDIEEQSRTQENDVKPKGIALFNVDEGVLEKSFFFPTSYPINPELLQEPPALSFLYEDLYEKATKDENEPSDAESTSSGATFHSRISDDDGTGIYFEKYILKDEIPLEKGKQPKDTDQFDDFPDERTVVPQNQEVLSFASTKRSTGEKTGGHLTAKLNKNQDDTQVHSKLIHQEDQNATHVKPPALALFQESVNIKNKLETVVPDTNLEQEYVHEKVQTSKSEDLCMETEDIADLLDYVVISQDDLFQDELSHEELTSEEREVLGHGSEGGFDFITDADQIPHDQEDSGFEIIEHDKPPTELCETDAKNAQVDTYCYTCKIPIVAIDKIFGDHKDHDVTTIENAVNEMTENLENLSEKLQESSMKTEDFVSRIEALFNDVEINYMETEKLLQEENEKMVQKVIAQHAAQRESFEELKKRKMEYLQEQILTFQKNADSAREILDAAAKEMEELDPVLFLSSHEEINNRLHTAMKSSLSPDKMPSASSLFEKCTPSSTSEDPKTQTKRVPVPQTPKLRAQEPNSATSTSITVYWTMREDDVIDCFQVYCMEEPQVNREENGLLEEYRVTVKESFCILEDLEPDKSYNVWVMAVNYTGCSFPSDRSTFRTAPSTPVIKAEECTVCWDTAVIRWNTAHPESTDSFTLEWCKQYSSEGEGLRSITGVKDQQLKVTLQPNENYFFYVRAASSFGSSEQSEAALISTKGTRFHLLRDTAHPALDLSPDGSVISISEQSEITGIPLVLGELLPATGRHYWEMLVNGCSSYSIGATFHPSIDEYPLVQESTSWCMQCYSTSTSFSYKFLHNEVLSEVHLTEPPVRVGILLDYTSGRLSFYNVQKGNLLFTFRHKFTEAAHPTFALEAQGELHLHTGIELPRFAKQS
ncbi:cardiomyopathy-associated protein 5 [Pelodytes ibericus]